MILENNGREFKIKWDNKEYDIPKGQFEVGAELGAHIISATKKWEGIEIKVVSKATEEAVKPQDPVPTEAPAEEPAPEAPTEEEKVDPTVDTDLDKAIEEDEKKK